MSLPLIQINGKCEVPIQIISLIENFRCCFWIIYMLSIFYKMIFFADGQTHVRLKSIVQNLKKN